MNNKKLAKISHVSDCRNVATEWDGIVISID